MQPGAQALPCVAWLDDDASVRKLVAMALEDLPIELQLCGTVQAAREVLLRQPVQLLVTDLMLPGENGCMLLEELDALTAHSAAGQRPRVVVFSARSDLPAQADLQRWNVWRVLSKPAPLASLLACVREALGLAPADTGGRHPAGPDAAPAAAPAAPDDAAAPTDRRSQAVAAFFGGDAALFDAFEASCRQQLPLDIAAADRALRAHDAQALLHLVHNFKGVLRGLGYAAAAAQAAQLERQLQAGDASSQAAMAPGWAALRAALLQGPLAD